MFSFLRRYAVAYCDDQITTIGSYHWSRSGAEIFSAMMRVKKAEKNVELAVSGKPTLDGSFVIIKTTPGIRKLGVNFVALNSNQEK